MLVIVITHTEWMWNENAVDCQNTHTSGCGTRMMVIIITHTEWKWNENDGDCHNKHGVDVERECW